MENRTVTLSRLLALIAYIDRYPGLRTAELASHFGRTEKQIRNDIVTLDDAGYGDLLPDKKLELDMDRYLEKDELAIFSSLQVKSSPRLTATEAASLILGLEAIAPTLSGEEAAAVPVLISSVLALADGDGSEAASKVRVIESNFPIRTWQQVRGAIQDNRRLTIRYISSEQRHSQRDIDPLSLSRTDDGWLLRAWCHEVGGIRSFRVDRILSCEVLDVPQDHPQIADEAPGDICRVVLRPQAGWRTNELPVTSIEHEGHLAVASFQVWSEAWMIGRLLALAEDIEAVEPESLKISAGIRAREALAVWDSF